MGSDDPRNGGRVALLNLAELKLKRGELCEWCGLNPATEKHHALVHRMKDHPELDDERNIMLVCHNCHESGWVNSYGARVMFWYRQKERYPDIKDWYSGLELKVKENFEIA